MKDNNMHKQTAKTILGIKPLEWRDNEASTIHEMYFSVFQTSFSNYECWTAMMTDGKTEGYNEVLGSTYKSFEYAKNACEMHHQEIISSIIELFCIADNQKEN